MSNTNVDKYVISLYDYTGEALVPWAEAVEPEQGHSRQHLKLGGRSMKTKNIRSATPRGFARAVFLANGEYKQ